MNLQKDKMIFDKKLEIMSDQEIVDRILRDAIISKHPTIEGDLMCLFSYGSKNLEVFYHRETQDVSTLITTDHSSPKKERETTLVYAAAKRFIITLVNSKRTTVKYSLLTENPNMKIWAETQGKKVFAWDVSEVLAPQVSNGPEVYRFTKNFFPRTRRQN